MSLLVYLASRVLVVILHLDDKHRFMVTLAVGAVSIVYTSMGGMRAVVATDTVQFFFLLVYCPGSSRR